MASTSAVGAADRERIDPLELQLALPPGSPRLGPAEPLLLGADAGGSPRASTDVEARFVEEVVRRVAWGGDRRRGVARIELDGDYRGTTIWVRSEGRGLELTVELGPGLDVQALPARLVSRLRGRGLEIAGLEVR